MHQLSDIREAGPTLSKFFTYNENSIRAMSEPYLWFSTFAAFNDPFEGAIQLADTVDPKEWGKVAAMIEARHPHDPGYRLMVAAMRQCGRVGTGVVLRLEISSLTISRLNSLNDQGRMAIAASSMTAWCPLNPTS
jgi:hypothetical protein